MQMLQKDANSGTFSSVSLRRGKMMSSARRGDGGCFAFQIPFELRALEKALVLEHYSQEQKVMNIASSSSP